MSEPDSFHKANKMPLATWLVGEAMMRPALRRAFGGVYASVDPAALKVSKQRHVPLIFCATHSGWWDGHMAFILDRKLFRRNPYLMMEEKHLARYPFFTWMGTFGVSRDDPRAALASINYITDILATEPNAALWMFPQGSMAHQDARPLLIYGGAAHVARRLDRCAIVPVALRYDFRMEQAPSAFARVGAPIMVGSQPPPAKALTLQIRDAMTEVADRVRDDVYTYKVDAHQVEGYRRILRGRGSINENWDRARASVRRVLRGSG